MPILYKKAGVVVMGIAPTSPIQLNLFDINAERFEKLKSLDKVIDRINKVNGTETVILAAQQYRQKNEQGKSDVFANAIIHSDLLMEWFIKQKDTDNLFDYQCFRWEKFVLRVELGGVEPPSKQVTNTLSTCLFFDWFSSRTRTKTPKSDLIP